MGGCYYIQLRHCAAGDAPSPDVRLLVARLPWILASLYGGYIGTIGLCRGYIGTIGLCRGYIGTIGLCRGYIGIMEKEMETTIQDLGV